MHSDMYKLQVSALCAIGIPTQACESGHLVMAKSTVVQSVYAITTGHCKCMHMEHKGVGGNARCPMNQVRVL
jgi:hypothetical protein